MPNANALLSWVSGVNLGLLAFNILPIYPLDGGQILRSLFWFVLGRARSLVVATTIGFVGVVGFIGLALARQSAWIGIIAAFILLNCWSGLQHARALLRLAKLPRREGFTCPWCGTAPAIGEFWKCNQCGRPFDTFQTQGTCPNCRARFEITSCLDCRHAHPISEWIGTAVMTSRF